MWGIMLPLATAILYETAFPENENDTGVITRMSKMFKLFNLTYQILRFNVNPVDWYTGLGVVVFNCVTVIGMLYLREQLLQVIERTRNEQRDRIRNQVERDNRDLNTAIQRALRTVDQVRDAERNIDFARQLTEDLAEISDGELENRVLLPAGLEHADLEHAGALNPQNRDAFSFTDDDSEVGETGGGLVEDNDRPYPEFDNVRIMRNLGSGDVGNVEDLSGTDETEENDPLYEGEFTPNSGSASSYDDSDASYNEFDDSEEWSSYTGEEEDDAAAAQPLRNNQIGNGDFIDIATPNLENDENLIENHQNLRFRGALPHIQNPAFQNPENQPGPENAYADQNPPQNQRGNLQNFLDDFDEFDEDIDNNDNLEHPDQNLDNGEENDNLGMINNLDITWQGVIGVDGSFQFFEHVFYALIINGVALYVFWVTPMVIGKIVFEVFGGIFGVTKVPRILNPVKTALFIMIGYTSIAACLGVIGKLRKVLYIRKRMKFLYVISRFSNNVYLWMKVALLMFNELMVYPTIIGVWINICTIDMVGNTGEYRINTFEKNPMSILFAHWFAGMTTVFQFVSAVMAIRKVTRPGLIWFVRNLDDQDYSPLKDMLESTSFIHIKRFCYTCALLGWCIFVCIWVPSTAVKSMGIVDLPFSKARYVGESANSTELNGNSTVLTERLAGLKQNSTVLGNSTVLNNSTVSGVNSTSANFSNLTARVTEVIDSEANFSETYLNPISILNDIPKHFILLQILVPMLNMDGQRLATKFLSKFINLWCLLVGQLLGLRSYLMGITEENEDETGPVYQPKMVSRKTDDMPGGARQFLMGKYKRKTFFQFRIFGFLSALVFTLSFLSGVLLFVPILTGRKAIYQIHKIYVAASNEPRLDGPVEQVILNSTVSSENSTSASQSKILAKYGQTEVVNAWILGAFLLWVPINLIYILYKSLLKALPILKNLQTKDYILKIKTWSKYSVKLFAFLTLVAVIMPIILGVFTTTVVVSPLKNDKNEDAIVYLTNDWIFGFLLQKIFVGICLVAPAEWGWREVVGGLHRNGDVDLKYTLRLCLRAVNLMAVVWAAPYLLAYGVLPLAFSGDLLVNIQHAIYPSILAMIGGVFIAKWNFSCFQALCDGIKQKRYLLGNQLINNEDTR
jgi:hypothetical protein